jgi:hypothetical protein
MLRGLFLGWVIFEVVYLDPRMVGQLFLVQVHLNKKIK